MKTACQAEGKMAWPSLYPCVCVCFKLYTHIKLSSQNCRGKRAASSAWLHFQGSWSIRLRDFHVQVWWVGMLVCEITCFVFLSCLKLYQDFESMVLPVCVHRKNLSAELTSVYLASMPTLLRVNMLLRVTFMTVTPVVCARTLYHAKYLLCLILGELAQIILLYAPLLFVYCVWNKQTCLITKQ